MAYRRYPAFRRTPSRVTSLVSFGSPAGGGGGPFFRVEVYQTSAMSAPMDISDDVLGAAGVRIRYGISGNGPLDRVAPTGEFHCTLRNDAGNSAGLQGYYSPSHANVRSGWEFGTFLRAIFTSAGTEYIKFTGQIRSIAPDAGQYGPRRVAVVAYDGMRHLAEADAREVTIQVDKSEDELLNELIAVMPANSLPVSTAFDAGVDQYPYAFDNVQGGTKVLAVMRDVVVSSFGLLFAKGNGQLTYLSRHAMSTLASSATFTDATLFELSVPSSLDGVFDRARVTTHPKQVTATATDELYTLAPGTSVEIPPNGSIEVWTSYTDPDDRQLNIGGTNVVTALVAGTHYAANSAADGSGSDLTASISPSIDAFGTTAKWTIANSSSSTAFLTTQKVIGKAVRDPGPQTFESPQGATGGRPIEIDLPYQDDPYIGQSSADYVVATYSGFDQHINSLAFVANKSPALMLLAMEREPGDLITISETVTGLSSVTAIIQSVEFDMRQGQHVICRWGLRPANDAQFWQWGIASRSEWGQSTVYAF